LLVPFEVRVIALSPDDPAVRDAEGISASASWGVDVLFGDRDERPGRQIQ